MVVLVGRMTAQARAVFPDQYARTEACVNLCISTLLHARYNLLEKPTLRGALFSDVGGGGCI